MRRLPLLAGLVVFRSLTVAALTAAEPSAPPSPPAPDVYKYAGLPPDKAAAAMTVPEGFSVSLFAGEPDVQQPIAMCLDDRGRLWVAEAYSYPVRRPESEGKDRILIFEDTKGTGTFDKRTVFMEGLNLVSGLEVGFGGVWIGAAPYLMFVPIKDGARTSRPGQPQILLDGWHYEDTHETLNDLLLGAGRLAVRLPRRLHPLAASASRARRTRTAPRSTPASGAIIRQNTSLKSSPRARAIRGASTSTSTARRS